jgi:hypothetical protein
MTRDEKRREKAALAEIQAELDRGEEAAKALVDHLRRMGAAATSLPVKRGRKRYVVTVAEQGETPPQIARGAFKTPRKGR